MAAIPELLNKEDWKAVLSSVDTVLFDCDGDWHCQVSTQYCACGHGDCITLFVRMFVFGLVIGVLYLSGNQSVPGAHELVRALKEQVR